MRFIYTNVMQKRNARRNMIKTASHFNKHFNIYPWFIMITFTANSKKTP